MSMRIAVLDIHVALHLVERRHQKAPRVDFGSGNRQQA